MDENDVKMTLIADEVPLDKAGITAAGEHMALQIVSAGAGTVVEATAKLKAIKDVLDVAIKGVTPFALDTVEAIPKEKRMYEGVKVVLKGGKPIYDYSADQSWSLSDKAMKDAIRAKEERIVELLAYDPMLNELDLKMDMLKHAICAQEKLLETLPAVVQDPNTGVSHTPATITGYSKKQLAFTFPKGGV